MGARRGSPRWSRTAAAVLVVLSLGASATVLAQPNPGDLIGPTPTPQPTAPPPPGSTPGPTAEPTPTPLVPGLDPTPAPTATPGPGSPTPGTQPPDAPDLADLEEPGDFPIDVPVLPRTAPRNTGELVEILREVTAYGVPLEEALVEGMGRFPVAGLAFWSDDWMFPRYTPYPHLHEGVDIFADAGTPIRSPAEGVVTRTVDGPVGGIAVWMRAEDGVQYYFAHLQEWAEGIEPGAEVDVGTVLGTVGDSGNAKGGTPHLHFEVHDPNETPPKPIVDAWLDEAIAQAPAWVEGKIADVVGHRELLRAEQSLAGIISADAFEPAATPEYSIVLTLLNPVGGSVGLLPRLPIVRAPDDRSAERLLEQIVELRVGGGVLFGGPGEAAYHDASSRAAAGG